MRYKTRKYIRKTVLYLLNTTVIILLYVIAAQKLVLPAFFEYYTGDLVRKNTAVFYQTYLGSLAGDASGATTETDSGGLMNLVDFMVREPNYLYLKNVLETIDATGEKVVSHIPRKIKDDMVSVATHPALIEWVKNPKGEYAPIYQYEAIRFIDGLASLADYAVLGNDSKLLFSKGKAVDFPATDSAPDLDYKDGLVSIVVKYRDKRIGKVIADTGGQAPAELNFENTGLDVSYFILEGDTPEKARVVRQKVSPVHFQKWAKEGVYQGFFSGIHDGYRFLKKKTDRYNLIVVYRAESAFFYVFKFVLYLILVLFILGLLYALKQKPWTVFFKNRGQDNLEHLLKKSHEIGQDYAESALKIQNTLQQMKTQELDRLRLISDNLGFLRQSVYEAMDPNTPRLKGPK